MLRNGLLRYILHTCPKLWCNSCSKCYGMDCFGTYFTHVQSCDVTRVVKVLRNGLLRYILHTCPKLWCNSCSKCYGMDCFGTYFTCPKLWCNTCSKCYGMDCFRPKCYWLDCFGTYFTHAQTCDVTRVQSDTEWTASVHILHTCPKLWCNSCSKCYGMDCFGTYFTYVQSCDVTRVRSATEWTASVHTSHMSKAVMQLVFKVLRNGLLRYILHTCPNLWCNPCSKCYGMDCYGTYFTHAQSCDVTHVQSATEWTASVQSVTEWTASVHTSHMPKAVM